MSDWFLLYMFTRLDAVKEIAVAGAILGGAASFFLVAVGFIHERPDIASIGKRLAAIALAGLVLSVVAPSRSDMAIIVGGKIALDASRSDTAREVGSEVLAAIRAQLKKAAE